MLRSSCLARMSPPKHTLFTFRTKVHTVRLSFLATQVNRLKLQWGKCTVNSTTLIKENLVFCPDPVQKMKSTGSGYGTNHQSKYRRTNYLTSGASAVHRVALYEVATGWIWLIILTENHGQYIIDTCMYTLNLCNWSRSSHQECTLN